MLFTDQPPASHFQHIIQLHLERYPLLEIPDLYKLVHQAALGNSHLTTDLATVTRQLQLELEQVVDSDAWPMVENITPDQTLIRVRLAPFKAFQLKPQALAAAMVASAREFQGSHPRLREYWQVVERNASRRSLRFTRAELEAYIKPLAAQNFPARHHSETYRRLYQPAYRVIMGKFMSSLLETS
ncbi:hypothetical protein L0128_08335 [candidate division KSB1 bacterium]|nr:hypothetical protein [candidate division KSB1 bacterium]